MTAIRGASTLTLDDTFEAQRLPRTAFALDEFDPFSVDLKVGTSTRG